MNLNLEGLEKFSYSVDSGNTGRSWIEDGKLKVKGNVSFEKLMFTMAYNKYCNTCYYCGVNLTKEKKTIDHKVPIIFGGVSILENIVPCCKHCNEEKSNLTDIQYKQYLNIEDQENRRRFKLKCIGKNEREHLERGSILPVEWFEKKKNRIFIDVDFDQNVKGAKYIALEELYLKHGIIGKPVIISSEGIIIDGFITVWLCKNENVKTIPVIKLENVDRLG